MVLYIHVPFCASKCGYCAFSSYTGVDSSLQDAYIQSLLCDIRYTLGACVSHTLESTLLDSRVDSSRVVDEVLDSTSFTPITLDSIYIGGGTPNLLHSDTYSKIFNEVARYCDMQSVREITIEANPSFLQAQWCKELANLGVGRISLGIQSFDEKKLAFLERDHSGRDIYRAIEIAWVFPHRSVDMIYGTPCDDENTLRKDMQQACMLDIDHFSAYTLMIEDGARFAHKHKALATPSPIEADWLEKQAHIVREIALQQGFYQYEVSNFAHPYKCLHNCKYWASEEYVGCGVSAVGRVGQMRYRNSDDLRSYIKNPLRKDCENLSARDLAFEALFLGLRSDVGVAISTISPYIDANRLNILLEEGVCDLQGDYLLARDMLLADEIAIWLMDK